MSTALLEALDIFFILFHTIFTLFNVFGWVWKRTRRLHLVTMGLTLFSWMFLGIWYGFGFCFCTEWHWRVMERLGKPPVERGYIEFLIRRLLGLEIPAPVVERWTLIVMALLLTATLFVNLLDLLRRRSRRP